MERWGWKWWTISSACLMPANDERAAARSAGEARFEPIFLESVTNREFALRWSIWVFLAFYVA